MSRWTHLIFCFVSFRLRRNVDSVKKSNLTLFLRQLFILNFFLNKIPLNPPNEFAHLL